MGSSWGYYQELLRYLLVAIDRAEVWAILPIRETSPSREVAFRPSIDSATERTISLLNTGGTLIGTPPDSRRTIEPISRSRFSVVFVSKALILCEIVVFAVSVHSVSLSPRAARHIPQ